MHITTDAIVLREHVTDEFDSVLTLLTKERGVITAYARGARKPRGAMRLSAELLSYSCFVLFYAKGKYSVDKADVNNVFMGVRGDVEKLSLASYFCQLAGELAPREENAAEYLRLLLNCLHLLDRNKRSCTFLKPLFELRLLTMAGFMPSLVCCGNCGCFEAEQMFFLPQSGDLICAACAPGASAAQSMAQPLTKSVLAAMRHILYAESAKLFSFTLPDPALARLSEVVEQYATMQLDRRFDTLDFYLAIRRPLFPAATSRNLTND